MSGIVRYLADIDRWFVYDARGRAVGWRKTEAEAQEVAASLPGEPEPRVRPERKMMVSEIPVTHKELRQPMQSHQVPTVRLGYARGKQMTRRR